MIDKNKNEENASVTKQIAQKHDIAELVEEMDRFIVLNKEYKAHILMIGGYSAGKSALLNKYIGKNVLKESQRPETDIAAELYFSEAEHIMANMSDGKKRPVLSAENTDLTNVQNLEYYINSENLKIQNDYIMVDTPGFDSGIEKHNKALMQYIGCGTAFFLVVDCEKGTISESTLNFVNEVANYSSDIAIIINKCDKKTSDEVQKVKEHIESLLIAYTGYSYPIISTSIFDDDVALKLRNLVSSFDAQELYDKNITDVLKRKVQSLIDALELIKENADCDTEEIEQEIKNREKAKATILRQVENYKKKMSMRLHNEVKERILSNINSQLLCNAESLAEAYKGGVSLFQERVVGIIRPVMISEFENYSSSAYQNLLKNINFSSLKVEKDSDKLKDIMDSVYLKLQNVGNVGELYNINGDDTKTKGLLRNDCIEYRAVTSALAIVTSILEPVLELVIVFLPDIINLVQCLITGQSKEKTKDNSVKEAIQNQVIPQIISNLRTEVDNSLVEVEEVVIAQVTDGVNEILNVENSALETAINKKKQKENEYSVLIASIDEDIKTLRKLV